MKLLTIQHFLNETTQKYQFSHFHVRIYRHFCFSSEFGVIFLYEKPCEKPLNKKNSQRIQHITFELKRVPIVDSINFRKR